MGRYATRWKRIERDEYFKIYRHSLDVYSSFTSPDGCELSDRPAMKTTWGDGEKELIRSEASKKSRHDKDWKYEYWKAIEWEENQNE